MNALKKVVMFPQRTDAAVSPENTSYLETGRVVSREGGNYLLLINDRIPHTAQRAAGCLLEPETGDMVLLIRNSGAGSFILSVLLRAGGQSRILIEGDTLIEVKGGELKLEGETLSLRGTDSASIEAPLLEMGAARAKLLCSDLDIAAEQGVARFSRFTLTARVIDKIAERITERVRDCFRWIGRIDQTRAGEISVKSEGRLAMHGGDASITAVHDVKIDGAKIRLG